MSTHPDIVRVGVIGAGSMGRTHVAAFSLHPQAEVVCICEPDADRLREVADEFGVPGRAATIDGLLAHDLEAVVVATPESMHLAPAVDALRSGRHVLVEKPLTTDVPEARELVDAAVASGLVVLPGLNLRYEPRYRQVMDWLTAGERGAIVSMYLRRNRPAPLFEHYQRVHPAYETGSHDVDLVLWYTGSRARRVYAVERRRPDETNPFALWGLIELQNGVVAAIETVWLTPGAAAVDRSDAFELIAERGTAHVDIANNGTVFWQETGRASRDPILDPSSLSPVSLAVRAEVEDFIACVRGERSAPVSSLADALHGVEIVDALIRSAEHGTPVSLD